MIKDDEKYLFKLLISLKNNTFRYEILDGLNIPNKRIDFILNKWSKCGIWNSGINIWYGWFEFESLLTQYKSWFKELTEDIDYENIYRST